ncbi:MAG: hypothetical protein AAF384_09975 [Pseudomonadota bacterium]
MSDAKTSHRKNSSNHKHRDPFEYTVLFDLDDYSETDPGHDRQPGDIDSILYLQITHKVRTEDLENYVETIMKPRDYKTRGGRTHAMTFVEALEEKMNWRMVHAGYPNTGNITISEIKIIFKLSEGLVRGRSIAYAMRQLGSNADPVLRKHFVDVRKFVVEETQNLYSSMPFDPLLLGRDRNIWIRDAAGDIFLIDTLEAWDVLKKYEILRGETPQKLKEVRKKIHGLCLLGAAFSEEVELGSKKAWLFNLSSLKEQSSFQKVSFALSVKPKTTSEMPRKDLVSAPLSDINTGPSPLFVATSSEHLYQIQPYPRNDAEPKQTPGVYKANTTLKRYLSGSGRESAKPEYLQVRRVFENKIRMAHLLNVRDPEKTAIGQGVMCKVIDLKKY